MSVPYSYGSAPEWMRLVAVAINPLLNSQYTVDSARLTYSGNALKMLRVNSTEDGVELTSQLDTVTFAHSGTQVAVTAPTGIDLSSGKALSVNGTQVVAGREAGWAADTGTAEKTAKATYTAGTTLTFSASYVQSEHTALATRLAAVETAVQNTSRGKKALKDALISHGLIGT